MTLNVEIDADAEVEIKYCARGHAITGSNISIRRHASGNETQACRTCRNGRHEDMHEQRELRRAHVAREKSAGHPICKRGHAITGDNAAPVRLHGRELRPICKKCKAAAQARSKERKLRGDEDTRDIRDSIARRQIKIGLMAQDGLNIMQIAGELGIHLNTVRRDLIAIGMIVSSRKSDQDADDWCR